MVKTSSTRPSEDLRIALHQIGSVVLLNFFCNSCVSKLKDFRHSSIINDSLIWVKTPVFALDSSSELSEFYFFHFLCFKIKTIFITQRLVYIEKVLRIAIFHTKIIHPSIQFLGCLNHPLWNLLSKNSFELFLQHTAIFLCK